MDLMNLFNIGNLIFACLCVLFTLLTDPRNNLLSKIIFRLMPLLLGMFLLIQFLYDTKMIIVNPL